MQKIVILKKSRGKKPKKPTLRQQRALTELVANGGNKTAAIRAAGYSEAMVQTPSKVFGSEALQPAINKIIENYTSARDMAVQILVSDMKVGIQNRRKLKANSFAVAAIAKMLTHDIELLSGRATERDFRLNDEERKAVESAFNLTKAIDVETK